MSLNRLFLSGGVGGRSPLGTGSQDGTLSRGPHLVPLWSREKEKKTLGLLGTARAMELTQRGMNVNLDRYSVLSSCLSFIAARFTLRADR